MAPLLGKLRKNKVATILATALIATALLAGYAFANRVPVRDVQSITGNRVLVPSTDLDIVRATWSIDAEASLVRDVDLLVFMNSQVWKLKLFEFFVQVSCLDESKTPPTEFICSTGSTKAVLPSHWIGLRPIRVDLKRPINPETTEIHDLSFIVTDLNPVPQTRPALFVGAMPAQIKIPQGGSMVIDVVTHGVRGVPAGTEIFLSIGDLPEGVSASFFDVFALAPFGEMKIPHSTAKLRLTAAAKAPLGERDATIKVGASVGGTLLNDQSMAEIEVVAPATTPGAAGG